MRSFVGLVNHYRRFMPKAAEPQIALNKHLLKAKKNDKTPIAWDDETEQAFKKSKDDLVKITSLAFPSVHNRVRLVTDASDIGMGAVIEQ